MVELTASEADAMVPELPAPVDLVLLDHWKELYVRDFDAVWPSVRVGGVVVADNMLMPPTNAALAADYQQHVHRQGNARTLTLPIGDGVELTTKIAEP